MGSKLYVLDGHTAIVTSVTFSPDGLYLASTSYDKSSFIWKLQNSDADQNDDFNQTGITSPTTEEQTDPESENDKTASVAKVTMPKSSSYPLSLQSTSSSQQSTATPTAAVFDGWSCDDVCDWLTNTLQLPQYADVFRENELDGAELASLTSDVLQNDLNIKPLGHRNKIIRSIKEMQKGGVGLKPAANAESTSFNLESLLNSLPPAIRQLAPGIVKTIIDQQKSLENHSDETRQWQSLSRNEQVKVTNVVEQALQLQKDIPPEFLCPITLEVMKDPVMAADGFTYERKSIENWLRKDRLPLSPMTNKVLANKSLVPNQTLKSMIVQHLDRAAAASSTSAEMTEEPVE